jgi:hypothetical protein
MKNAIFWDITPCSPLKGNLRFGGICSETSVDLERTIRRYIQEDEILHNQLSSPAIITHSGMKNISSSLLKILTTNQVKYPQIASDISPIENRVDEFFFSYQHYQRSTK